MSTTEQKAARWYAVDIDGAATLCVDHADAKQEAADAQAAWPGMGPHRAVQLVEAPMMGAAGDAGWVSVDERLPEPGKPVLLDIGKKHPIRAMWAAKYTVQAADDDTEWGDYVEADDMYYCPEGWYEWNLHEECHWAVSETPRAWCELPAVLPPAPSTEGESNE